MGLGTYNVKLKKKIVVWLNYNQFSQTVTFLKLFSKVGRHDVCYTPLYLTPFRFKPQLIKPLNYMLTAAGLLKLMSLFIGYLIVKRC